MRLVIDTCVVVAGVKSTRGASRVILDMASTGEITAVITTALVSEYQDVIFREHIRPSGWSDDHLHAVIDSLLVPSEWTETHFSYRPLLRDPGDELVLSAAINGQAHIVTFNVKHFGPASQFGILVLKPSEALEMLNERSIGRGTD